MAWYVPPLPRAERKSKVAYWFCLLEIPNDEPAAEMLKAMAMQRLLALGAISQAAAEAYLAGLTATTPNRTADNAHRGRR
jgi:hypothetical protein